MKLRKSLAKPEYRTQQNILSCLVLPPEIVMRDAFNVILWTSADICVMQDDLRWKNLSIRYNCRFSATSLALRVIFSGRTTEHHIVIDFGELAAVD